MVLSLDKNYRKLLFSLIAPFSPFMRTSGQPDDLANVFAGYVCVDKHGTIFYLSSVLSVSNIFESSQKPSVAFCFIALLSVVIMDLAPTMSTRLSCMFSGHQCLSQQML